MCKKLTSLKLCVTVACRAFCHCRSDLLDDVMSAEKTHLFTKFFFDYFLEEEEEEEEEDFTETARSFARELLPFWRF